MACTANTNLIARPNKMTLCPPGDGQFSAAQRVLRTKARRQSPWQVGACENKNKQSAFSSTRTVIQSLQNQIYFLPLKMQQIYLGIKMGMGILPTLREHCI